MRRSCWWLLLALAGPALGGEPAGAGPPAMSSEPAVQVVAFLDPVMGYEATVAYRVRVARDQVKRELKALALGLGYGTLQELRRSAPGKAEPQPLHFDDTASGSEIGFRLSERAFNRAVGTFKLEPFVAIYRAYGRIDLDFVVGDLDGKRFSYRGLGDYENRYVRIRHHGQGTSHSFAIEVLDPSFAALDLPPFAPPKAPVPESPNPNKESGSGRANHLVLGAALAAGLVSFMVLIGLLRRRQGARR